MGEGGGRVKPHFPVAEAAQTPARRLKSWPA
jgi:hypothetical protein